MTALPSPAPASPAPTSADVASRPRLVDARTFFETVAARYDRVYALTGALSKERLARVLRAVAGKRDVLVLGIGTGRELPALLDAGHQPIGLDFSPSMLAVLGRRARVVPTVVGDFWECLPFPGASFDAVLALHGTLAHPPGAPLEALAQLGGELARVLRPGASFVAEVPAAEALEQLAATQPDAPVRVRALPGRRFVHEDDVARIALEGVALRADEWRSVLGGQLDVDVSPLPPFEHFVRAVRKEAP